MKEQIMPKIKNLSKLYVAYSDNPENVDKCVNDFFKFAGVKKKHRSDFLFASILRGSVKIIKKQEKEFSNLSKV